MVQCLCVWCQCWQLIVWLVGWEGQAGGHIRLGILIGAIKKWCHLIIPNTQPTGSIATHKKGSQKERDISYSYVKIQHLKVPSKQMVRMQLNGGKLRY